MPSSNIHKVKVGVIGCGTISDTYISVGKRFHILDFVACADLDVERAQAKAEKHGVSVGCTVKDLLADPSIEVIINLTTPNAHAAVALAAVRSGKSVYNEKPLAVDKASAREVLDLAALKGLFVGCAPDTFLGGGLQTCRKIIDDGLIGDLVGASAHMMCRGHESWHPDPDFYYQPGGGPLFDMGPYYLTALIALLGPISRVTGCARKTFSERLTTSQPHPGRIIHVNVPTHVVGTMEFHGGPIATITTSFDVWSTALPHVEIYGTEGSLRLPDPNTFGGPVLLRIRDSADWVTMPLTHGYTENTRSLGVAEMCYAIRGQRALRASGELAYHVLDVMDSIHKAASQGTHVSLTSSCVLPIPLRCGESEDVLS